MSFPEDSSVFFISLNNRIICVISSLYPLPHSSGTDSLIYLLNVGIHPVLDLALITSHYTSSPRETLATSLASTSHPYVHGSPQNIYSLDLSLELQTVTPASC